MEFYLVIDAQNDFIDGALGSEEAQAAVPRIVEILKNVSPVDTKVIFTQDTHFSNYLQTLEGEKLPVPHCMFDTYGWRVRDEIQYAPAPDVKTFNLTKGTFAAINRLKDEMEYTDGLFKEYPNRKDVIHIMGFCTDICVISNALYLRSLFREANIVVHANACAGTSKDNHLAALQVMEACQIDIDWGE